MNPGPDSAISSSIMQDQADQRFRCRQDIGGKPCLSSDEINVQHHDDEQEQHGNSAHIDNHDEQHGQVFRAQQDTNSPAEFTKARIRNNTDVHRDCGQQSP